MSGKQFQKIEPALFWDPSFRQLGWDERLVYLFLMIHGNMTQLGAMRTTLVSLASEMGVKFDRFSAAFASLIEAGFVKYDEATMLLYLPGFLDKYRPANPNQVKSWKKIFSTLPACALREELRGEIVYIYSTLPPEFQRALDPNDLETVPQRFGNGCTSAGNDFETVSKHVDVEVDVGVEEDEKKDVDVAVEDFEL